MFSAQPTGLPGAMLLTLPSFEDARGLFIKTFQQSVWQEAGVDFQLKESYFSVSAKDVIRGMHFQLPPHEHAKIVFCPQGSILDVLLDLRAGSGTYGQFTSAVLSAQNHQAFYIPPGFAHGFKSLEDQAITHYLVSSEYHKESDSGILYSSFGMDWEVGTPIISDRDRSFSPLNEWKGCF